MDISNDNNSTKDIIQDVDSKKDSKSKDNKGRSKSPDAQKISLRDERARKRVEQSGHQNARVKLGWKSDLNKDVIIQNFTDRFWEETEDDDSWNFYWASVNTVRQIFNGKSYVKLNDYQILNHFPNFYNNLNHFPYKSTFSYYILNFHYNKNYRNLKHNLIDNILNLYLIFFHILNFYLN